MDNDPFSQRKFPSGALPAPVRLWLGWLSVREVNAGSICLQTLYPQGNCYSSISLFTKAVNM